MRMCSIASGSSGNCIYIGDRDTHILIDAGISKKKIIEGLKFIGVNPEDVQGIFVTHEHLDHIKGLGIMMRAYNVNVYSTKGTIDAILSSGKIGKIDESLFNYIKADFEVKIGELLVKPFSISHDASEPVCYVVSNKEHRMAVATDLGKYDEYILANLSGLDAVLIESNYDKKMLEVGSYPYYLKKRVASDCGHLCNEMAGKLICNIFGDRLKYVLLGHLSKENNYPELAYETVKSEILQCIGEFENRIKLVVAKRDVVSEVIKL